MTVEEIFTNLAKHMEKGIEMHKTFSKIYNFLELKGYKLIHYYHYLEEINNYHYLCHYYMNNYHKLINTGMIEDLKLIPAAWYKYSQFEVDINTKRTMVKDINRRWIQWEKETKKLYEEAYKQLFDLNEVSAALELKIFICDVSAELTYAEKHAFKLECLDYNINSILEEQKRAHQKYSKKLSEINFK